MAKSNEELKNKLATKAESAPAAASKPKTMKQYIEAYRGEIAKALPSVITPERFARMAMTAITKTPKLAETTPQSFIGALLSAAQLGLEPNTVLGQAYLIPYRNKGVMETQFQLGYKGMIELAYRSGEFTTIFAKEVYETDDFEYCFGLDPDIKHVPHDHPVGAKPTHYYAIFKLANGGYGLDVMSYKDVEQHGRKYSKTFSNGPWQTNFDEMAMKTVVKQVLKYAPLKSEFARQITSDESVKSTFAVDMTEVENENVFEGSYEEIPEDEAPSIDAETGEIIEPEQTEITA
jgi:recombination protein RecT